MQATYTECCAGSWRMINQVNTAEVLLMLKVQGGGHQQEITKNNCKLC